MPVITKISEQKRRANRRSVYLDGQFAFGCNINVIARFRLREGLTLDTAQVDEIQSGEVRQACMDHALKLLSGRLHSVAELRRKLNRHEWGGPIVEAVLLDLQRLNYLNDARFAKAKTESLAQHRRVGRQRAKLELIKSGVASADANSALGEVYGNLDTAELARSVARKQLARLARFDPVVARRRLTAFLQRRGFDYDTIRPILNDLLKPDSDAD